MNHRRHLILPALLWAVVAVVFDLLIVLVLHLPPGYATTTSADQTVTGQSFAIIGGDVFFAVIIFGLYFIIQFSRYPNRERVQGARNKARPIPTLSSPHRPWHRERPVTL